MTNSRCLYQGLSRKPVEEPLLDKKGKGKASNIRKSTAQRRNFFERLLMSLSQTTSLIQHICRVLMIDMSKYLLAMATGLRGDLDLLQTYCNANVLEANVEAT
jgi:hypothetical protein